MGEKPLSIDEAPVQTATVGGVAPGTMPGRFDAPPPGMTAGSISTTRSNIKNSGSMAMAGDPGADDDRSPPIDGAAGVGTEGAPPPDMSGAAGINTTRSNIKNVGGVVAAGDAGADADRSPPIDGAAGIAIKEQGVK